VVKTTVYQLNWVSTKTVEGKTPFEVQEEASSPPSEDFRRHCLCQEHNTSSEEVRGLQLQDNFHWLRALIKGLSGL
jgi:hypothetical protein